MPDYVAIVKRSVEALSENNQAARATVYERARAALTRQLGAVTPELPQNAVDAQRKALEDAINQVETDYQASDQASAAPATERPPSAPPAGGVGSNLTSTPPPQAPTVPTPQPPAATSPNVPPPLTPPASAPTAPSAPSAAPPPLTPPTVPTPPAAAPRGPAQGHVASPAHSSGVHTGPAAHTHHSPAPSLQGQSAPPAHSGHAVQPTPGAPAPVAPVAHTAAPAADSHANHLSAGPAETVQSAPTEDGPDRQRYFGAGPKADADAGSAKPERSSRMATLVILILILLLGLGVAAVGYFQFPAVSGLFGGSSSEEQVATTEGSGETETSSEVTQQTGQTGETQTEQPATEAEQPATETVPEVRVVTPEEPNQGPQSTELQRPVGADDQATVQTPEPVGETTPTPSEPQENVLVGQRAIFYEQGEGEQEGSAVEGGVSWQTVPQSDGLDAIQATIDLPGREAKATITIRKNNDDGLPASHLIEIAFDNVSALSNGLIERIPALVLKPSEQERGQPLIGAAVPVTDTLFWIALSDEGDQVVRNTELMREGSWFDLPILFNGGQRALLTFEKGVAGDQVFQTVMAEWAQ